MVFLIQRFLFRFHSRKKVVNFCGVPSDVDVPGNDQTDKAANQASITKAVCRSYLPLLLQNWGVPATDFTEVSYVLAEMLVGGNLWSVKPFVRPWAFPWCCN